MIETGTVEVVGCKLHYQIEGAGLIALVIGSSAYYPKSFSRNLRAHLRLVFVDWRGFSQNFDPYPSTFDTLLDDIEQVRIQLGLENCIVIGHSAHALLALEYAKKYPQKVTHVVMIAMSPNLSPACAALAEHHWETAASAERKEAMEKRIKAVPDKELEKLPAAERFVAWYIRKDPQAWYDYNFDSAWLWEGISPNMPWFDYLYGVALREIDITLGLENFTLPVFLVLGKYDFIIAPPSSWDSVLNKFQDLTMRVFEHSGHSPQFEEPFLFDNELLSWIATHSKKNTKRIEVVPYNSDWPRIFENEALKIKEALGPNFLAIHHIGSTSVPGLLAKPVIDIIAVVKNPEDAIQALEHLGFKYKGEYNVPLRYYFNRKEDVDTNLHVYQEGHPEISLNLLFRDFLRSHPEAAAEYAKLKETLLKEKSSFEKTNSGFTGYNHGKDAFIRKILKAAHYDCIRIMKCMHDAEWEFAKKMRRKYFFDPLEIADPYTWTFHHQDHAHLIFYEGVDMIGYAHIQFWPEQRAALRIFVIDACFRKHGFGSKFLHLCEQWLKKKGIRSLHDEARPDAVMFYRKNGYEEMPFNDPSGEPPSPHDIAMGKIL